MDINQLMHEYKKIYRDKLHADLTFITLLCGIVGGLFGKLVGSIIGLVVGFFIGIWHFRRKLNEMEARIK